MKQLKLRSLLSLLLILALLAGLLGCSAAEVEGAAKTAGELIELVNALSEEAEPPKEEAKPEAQTKPDAEPPAEQPEQAPAEETGSETLPEPTEIAEKPPVEDPIPELPGLPLEQEQPQTPKEEETPPQKDEKESPQQEEEPPIDEDGEYTKKDDVALYLYTYGHLPKNFITKNEARKLGWSGGGLDRFSPGKCIGGDRFGNNEGLLPKKKGRQYYECDIDTMGKSSRGAKRIIYSDDGLIYYTDDHYESFTLLYGEE